MDVDTDKVWEVGDGSYGGSKIKEAPVDIKDER